MIEAIRKCSLLELTIEIIEEGRSGFVAPLRDIEPVPMEALLDEVSNRMGRAYSSPGHFLEEIVKPGSAFKHEEHEILLRAVNVKAAQRRFQSKQGLE